MTVTDCVAVISLNRPDVRNAIHDDMRSELVTAFEWVEARQEIRAVVLTGEGETFCSGGDIDSMHARLSAPAEAIAYNGWKRQIKTHRSIEVVHNLTKPVIAAVNGAAYGLGLNLAMACDFIIASSSATLCMSFMKRGLVPDAGAMYFLPRRVGLSRAKELTLTARVLSADEALGIGLVDRISQPESLVDDALAWAKEMSQGSPTVVALSKAILDETYESSLSQVFKLGREAQAICYVSSEHRIAVEAFLRKIAR
ncbi:enoyl-CoA hydratase [Agrobacterium tumefaciens str. Cherry 2E-2-2]|nr:enoyl-CoA hydratase [Agrobacterium tumefaciens str. Cherry 2E-2-2]